MNADVRAHNAYNEIRRYCSSHFCEGCLFEADENSPSPCIFEFGWMPEDLPDLEIEE